MYRPQWPGMRPEGIGRCGSLMASTWRSNQSFDAWLQAALPANDKRQDYVRARFVETSGDMPSVESFGKQDSSMMRIFSQSNCLIVRPPNAPEVEAGDTVPILLLRP